MSSVFAIGAGAAVAAFLGRAGLVAWRRSRGAAGAVGRAFYKGGFEPNITKREASLILSLNERTLSKEKPVPRDKGQRSQGAAGQAGPLSRR